MSDLRISVVISTLDRAEHLANALAALDRQSTDAFEVIVVNGPSKDRSAAIIAEYGSRLKSLECAEANLSMARNLGLARAAGDIVAFLDDDAVPHPGWLRELAAPFGDPDVGAVGGYVVGRNGLEYQARKIFCDRFGASHFVADWFDERTFSAVGSWAFPAPMGANMAFRRDALIGIRGFDERFAYYLDETDAFLRLHDAGWAVRFAPDALVWHQFAGSRLRDDHATPREMVTLARSKAYFVVRHAGMQPDAEAHLAAFQQEKRGYLGRLRQEGKLTEETHARLLRELSDGLDAGKALARTGPSLRDGADLAQATDFHAFRGPALQPLSIAFICRSFPPWSDAGIARWTRLAAQGLAARGATVHVVAEARDGPSLWFERGIWHHRIAPGDQRWDQLMDRFEMTLDSARWAAAVAAYAPVLQAFHVDVVSFPIWDCEGIALAETKALPCVLTLHTTSTLSRAEAGWTGGAAPEVGMAKAEACCLRAAPVVIANSAAALHDIERSSGVPIAVKSVIVPHGTPIADLAPEGSAARPMRVLFVGRAERRKGYDIALEAIAEALQAGASIEATFAGGVFHHPLAQDLIAQGRLKVMGLLERDALHNLYREHDLLLVPSRYESFGLVAIEAMAHGLAVVATAAGGLSEVILEGVNGHLVPLEQQPAQAMARHIVRLAEDRAALRRLRQGAHHDAEARFGVDLMAARLEEAYRRAVEHGKRPS